MNYAKMNILNLQFFVSLFEIGVQYLRNKLLSDHGMECGRWCDAIRYTADEAIVVLGLHKMGFFNLCHSVDLYEMRNEGCSYAPLVHYALLI